MQKTEGYAVKEAESVKDELNRLRRLVYEDELTGIRNLRAFRENLAQLIQEEKSFCIGYADVDNFKWINDRYGHAEGDRVITRAAEYLEQIAGEDAGVYRKGGDEFLLVAEGAGEMTIRERIARQLSVPFYMPGHPSPVGISIGFVSSPEEGTDAIALLEKADLRMYEDKRRKRERCWMERKEIDKEK